MRRLLITLLILLAFFAIFFYFSLGTEPKFWGEEVKNKPQKTYLDFIIKQNPEKYPYAYLEGLGYVLKNRQIVLLTTTNEDTVRKNIKEIEKQLESYWKWQIIAGNRSLEDINPVFQERDFIKKGDDVNSRSKEKNVFSRIFDVFKVADAVNVVIDKSKKCDCDDGLILLAGPELHLIQATLNPDGGGAGSGGNNLTDTPTDDSGIALGKSFKLPPPEPQAGSGKDKATQSSVVVTVGIIDTGINYGKQESILGSVANPTIDYNFLNHSADISDANSVIHGTKIARIIAKNYGSNIKIVGLKTFDENRLGNLFDNLCAILYSVKHDIKVVNVSWGVYENSSLFHAVMERVKRANTVLICSAGNEKIDLDIKPWFPASYADDSDFSNNIISVTSKNKEQDCQNFSMSSKKIDLSVQTGDSCTHAIPDSNGNMGTINESGTSYAAPYVVAELAKYKLINPVFSKPAFINSLSTNPTIKKYTH
jgi:Subtilase family